MLGPVKHRRPSSSARRRTAGEAVLNAVRSFAVPIASSRRWGTPSIALPQTSPSVASMSLPSTRGRKGARKAFPRTKLRATASGWPRSSRPVGSGRKPPRRAPSPPKKRDRTEEEPKFRSVGDELQTDETFDHDIIERMGARSYDAVFVRAITEVRAKRGKHEAIRDTIRRGCKPARAVSR